MMKKITVCVLMAAAGWAPLSVRAVLFASTGDPAFNTNAPSGSLEESGWQFQGRFEVTATDGYLGTPVSPHHFITARHIPNANAGDWFYFDGKAYETIRSVNDGAESDLMLWEVDGTFPRYAPLYTGSSEAGKPCMVFGRGAQRGTPVLANGQTKGWRWGTRDYVMRWGQNTVDDVPTVNGYPLLQMDFDAVGVGANECMMADKDSGGAVFIEEDGVWKLAGINWAVSPAQFSYSSDGSDPFYASVTDYSFRRNDAEKLYYETAQGWNYYSSSTDRPCTFFSSRISARYSWITNNIPEFDSDLDGMPDWWEATYGAMEPGDDDDNDGYTNYEEWLADTDPGVASDRFEILDWPAPSNVVFRSSSDRKYLIDSKERLTDSEAVWHVDADWFSGSEPQTVRALSPISSNRFYRIRVKVR